MHELCFRRRAANGINFSLNGQCTIRIKGHITDIGSLMSICDITHIHMKRLCIAADCSYKNYKK